MGFLLLTVAPASGIFKKYLFDLLHKHLDAGAFSVREVKTRKYRKFTVLSSASVTIPHTQMEKYSSSKVVTLPK